jgi:hypothetical protein
MITKNISNLLARGNLTPREKFLLLIHNDIERMKTGKDALTPADKEALENWQAHTNEDAREWNRLNDGWKLSGRIDIEAEFAFKEAQVAHLAALPIMLELSLYPLDRRIGFAIDALKRIKKVTIDEAVRIVEKQKGAKISEGMDFDYAVYQFAFEFLSPEDRKRMNELYPDVEYDHQYLDQEEIIAHLYDGKDELSDEAKDTLADLVAEQSYNKFAKEYQLFHYFACIPLLEVARHFLKKHGVEIAGRKFPKDQTAEDEDGDTLDAVTKAIEQYAEGHGTTVKAMLREGCRRWLDEGLLEEYTPLVVSDDAELLERWFKTKAKARKTLLAHIKNGELALRDRTATETRKEKLWSKGLYDREFTAATRALEDMHLEPVAKGELDEKRAFETFDGAVITGESIYAFQGNYEFVKDFKKRADTYDANLGLVYAESDPDHTGDHLDQELLVCDMGRDGEPLAFSTYGLNTTMIESVFKGRTLLEEYTKDGVTFLKFRNADIAATFRDRQKALIDGYAALLGFQSVLEKLSPIFETDMSDHVTQRLLIVRGFIEEHNKTLLAAADPDAGSKHKLFRQKEPMRFEEDFAIDVNAIKPDRKIIDEQIAKTREIFPEIK